MMEFKALRGPRLTLDQSSVLDIGACVVEGVDLSPGRAIPDDGDPRIDHSLDGFLFTCGPDHIRHPEPVGEGRGTYPLHGSFSSHPAEILSFETVEGNAEARAVVSVRLADGGSARLERLWRIDGKTGEVRLSDRVTNSGETPFPAMLMYHMNIGARHFDDGVRLEGAMLDGGGLPWAFGEDPGGVFCVLAAEEGEPWAEVRLGPIRAIGGKTLRVRFRTGTLPFLQVWRNQQAPANVLGIEPVSHRWEPRGELARRGELSPLTPGECRDYALSFAFV
ncbi:MAG: DUF4432 family protein [Rhizobium sp.]